MSELLSAIEFVPSKSSASLPAPLLKPPFMSSPVPTGLHTTADIPLIPGNSSRVPLDLEDGGLKQGRIVVIITVLTGVNFLSSLCNGFITIGLPRMASDLSLPEHLLLWPSAVY
jgi:hypothetical protein